MEKINLQATTRTVLGKKVKRDRVKGLMPAVVYGHGTDSTPIFVNQREFEKAFEKAGTSSLIDLAIDDKKPVKVLLHEPQMHYLYGNPVHADFYAVKMTEKIETAIPIHFVGAADAVEELGGNFIANKDELQIRCFPADLIPSVEVDISILKTFDDQIRVEDIKLPETIEVMHEGEEVIALVSEPRSEEELEAELADDQESEAAAVEELAKDDNAEEGEGSGEEKGE